MKKVKVVTPKQVRKVVVARIIDRINTVLQQASNLDGVKTSVVVFAQVNEETMAKISRRYAKVGWGVTTTKSPSKDTNGTEDGVQWTLTFQPVIAAEPNLPD